MLPRFAIVVVLVACAEPRTSGGAAPQAVPTSAVTIDAEPSAQRRSSAPPSATASPAATQACNTAYDDQRMLYVDAELAVHPLRKERFLFHCERLPRELQPCASPLYRQDHAAACDAAQDAGDRAAKNHWRAMFDLLGGVGETVTQPPPKE